MTVQRMSGLARFAAHCLITMVVVAYPLAWGPWIWISFTYRPPRIMQRLRGRAVRPHCVGLSIRRGARILRALY